jgi:hypothetical protein
MDRQYNYQTKHGQTIQRPHVSFDRYIACPFFFWSLYCLSMFLLVVVLSDRNMDRQYNDQKKHGQTIQRPKETWTDNTTTKGNMDRQYNDQRKHGQTMSMFLLVVILPVHVSFRSCIACPCFLQTIQRPKETWKDNTTTKRKMDRQYNDQKKHGQAIQLPK